MKKIVIIFCLMVISFCQLLGYRENSNFVGKTYFNRGDYNFEITNDSYNAGDLKISWPELSKNQELLEENVEKMSGSQDIDTFVLCCRNIELIVTNEMILARSVLKIEQETNNEAKGGLRIAYEFFKNRNERMRIVYLDYITKLKNALPKKDVHAK